MQIAEKRPNAEATITSPMKRPNWRVIVSGSVTAERPGNVQSLRRSRWTGRAERASRRDATEWSASGRWHREVADAWPNWPRI